MDAHTHNIEREIPTHYGIVEIYSEGTERRIRKRIGILEGTNPGLVNQLTIEYRRRLEALGISISREYSVRTTEGELIHDASFHGRNAEEILSQRDGASHADIWTIVESILDNVIRLIAAKGALGMDARLANFCVEEGSYSAVYVDNFPPCLISEDTGLTMVHYPETDKTNEERKLDPIRCIRKLRAELLALCPEFEANVRSKLGAISFFFEGNTSDEEMNRASNLKEKLEIISRTIESKDQEAIRELGASLIKNLPSGASSERLALYQQIFILSSTIIQGEIKDPSEKSRVLTQLFETLLFESEVEKRKDKYEDILKDLADNLRREAAGFAALNECSAEEQLETLSATRQRRDGQGYLVITAPSGTGKTTVGNKLKGLGIQKMPRVVTRAKRSLEENDVDYYFVTEADFQTMEINGELLLASHSLGGNSGTLKSSLEAFTASGRSFFIEGGLGTMKSAESLPSSPTSIVLLPTSFKEWMRRIQVRRKEGMPLEEVMRRIDLGLEHFQESIKQKNVYIVNDDLGRVTSVLMEMLDFRS